MYVQTDWKSFYCSHILISTDSLIVVFVNSVYNQQLNCRHLSSHLKE